MFENVDPVYAERIGASATSIDDDMVRVRIDGPGWDGKPKERAYLECDGDGFADVCKVLGICAKYEMNAADVWLLLATINP